MKKFTCPYCYEQHSDNDCTYKCSYNIVGVNKSCKYDFEKNPDGTIPSREEILGNSKSQFKEKYGKDCGVYFDGDISYVGNSIGKFETYNFSNNLNI